MPFRTTEVSNPQFESNNLRFITVKTINLKGRGDICVYVPKGVSKTETLPIVILLHGMYGSAWSWAMNGGVHIKIHELIEKGELPKMIIAMPSDGLWGDGSGYLPHSGLNFEKWIAEDVQTAMIENITGAKPESPLFIAGVSMGGFGALRIGAKYGHKFKAIAGLSPITSLPQLKLFAGEPLKTYAQDIISDEDVLATFKKYHEHLPPVRIDCGTNDQLINYNRDLHKKLEKEKIPHIYEEHVGGHEWSYWGKQIISTLKFFVSKL